MQDSLYYIQYYYRHREHGPDQITIYEDCGSIHPGMFVSEHNFSDDRRSLFACYPLSYSYVNKQGHMKYLYSLGISGQVAYCKTYTNGSFKHQNPDYWSGFDADSTYKDSYVPDFYTVISQYLGNSVVGEGRMIQPLGLGFTTLLQKIYNNQPSF